MPNHLYLLWMMELPHKREDVQRDFLKYMAQQIKFGLQKHLPAVLEKFKVGAKDQPYQVWERNPLSVYCYPTAVTEQKWDCIHINPNQDRWQLEALPEAYHYSSARFYQENPDNFGISTYYRDENLW